MGNLNESQKRALRALDALLEADRLMSMKAQNSKAGRTDPNSETACAKPEEREFLTTAARKPAWDKQPQIWAPDWCEGWAFKLPHAAASCLGIVLLGRSETIGHYVELAEHFVPSGSLDKNGKAVHQMVLGPDGSEVATRVEIRKHFAPEPKKDARGNIERGKKGFITPNPLLRRWLVWGQVSNFYFEEGQIFHSYPVEFRASDWYAQIQQNPFFIEITGAAPAGRITESSNRDSGYVRFKRYKTNQHHIYGEEKELETTQDGFIHYLITGQLP